MCFHKIYDSQNRVMCVINKSCRTILMIKSYLKIDIDERLNVKNLIVHTSKVTLTVAWLFHSMYYYINIYLREMMGVSYSMTCHLKI